MSNNGYRFSRMNCKGNIFQHIPLVHIREPNFVEHNFSIQLLGLLKTFFLNIIIVIQHLEYTITCHHAHLQHVEFICNYPQWPEEQVQAEIERNALTEKIGTFSAHTRSSIPHH